MIRFALVLFLMFAGFLQTRADESAAAQGDVVDVLCMFDSRPVVVRLHITSDGKPILEAWNHFADVLFAKLDADHNGVVDETEWGRVSQIMLLLSEFPNSTLEVAAAPRTMNRSEFREFLKKSSFGPFRVTSGPTGRRGPQVQLRFGGNTTSREELDKRLLELLDVNKDGKISAAEFTAGIEILTRLDVDENELVSADEILYRPRLPSPNTEMFRGGGMMEVPPSLPPARPPAVELATLTRKGTDALLAQRISARYGPRPKPSDARSADVAKADMERPRARPKLNRPNQIDAPPSPLWPTRRLTNKDLKLSDASFAALDQDGDGELDAEELARFAQHALVEVDIALRLGELAKGQKPAEVILEGKPTLKAYISPRGADTAVAIELPGVRLDFISSSSNRSVSLRLSYLRRFRNLDRDANGYVDIDEAANDLVFSRVFSILDKDGDGRIFENELTAVLDEIEEIAQAAAHGVISVECEESSPGLFGFIDTDGDGSLSVRELRAMPKLVERFGSNGALALTDLPRRVEATLSQGLATLRPALRRQQGFSAQRPRAGPLWFQKMDRNRDGDVSRREFLGTDEQFRKLDLDGDGLISVEEAEAADKKKEASKPRP